MNREAVITAVEELVDTEVSEILAQRESLRASMQRIRAAAESDADLEKLSALHDYLLRETQAVELPGAVIGYDPTEQGGLSELLAAVERCKNTTGCMDQDMSCLTFDRNGMRAFNDLYALAASLSTQPQQDDQEDQR